MELAVIALVLALPALVEVSASELIQPPICSAETAGRAPVNRICTARPLGNARNEVKVHLTAQTGPIEVGGYTVITENYNGNYLTPVIEVMPGDTVSARLVNLLSPHVHGGMAHRDADANPTNLHYFHGGIVSPNNARPGLAELGNGDNIYVHLKAGLDAEGRPNSFDFVVPIPGEQMLDARVLEGDGYISHPVGLNWYHSHLHGISSDQVMGGMSGLLSVGEAKANVKAACRQDPGDQSKCLNDVDKDTADLRNETEVRYAMLRDLPLQSISAAPNEASGATANWAPAARDFPMGAKCGVWRQDNSGLDTDNVKLRTGFCQRDRESAWLFTVNGQRFPTITVKGGKNLLLRLGNLSANVGYWLEMRSEANEAVLPLTLLSLDGVVPARPLPADQAKRPVLATNFSSLLLMPASRAEVYVRNDENPHATAQTYVLSTKGLNAGTDVWPSIQLARIVLEPNVIANKIGLALNASIATIPISIAAGLPIAVTETLPSGCVRDLDPAFHEYRRVTFTQAPECGGMEWCIRTEIVRPSEGPDLKGEEQFMPVDPDNTTVGPVPFEDYVQADGLIDWMKRHVCIKIDHGLHQGSHKQLWVLFNTTTSLHNFHIHQMKFRLATRQELEDSYRMAPPSPSHTCDPHDPPDQCTEPDYKFYDDQGSSATDLGATLLWHDTIPVPPFSRVFVIMSFDAKQQIGRFVFHCHILKHEDRGLMAPIEVWEPTAAPLAR